jgi:hypothetical protein
MVTKTSSRLTPIDWRTLPAGRVAPLYAAEIERWGSTLEWDTAKDWDEVEKGRQLGTVAGIVVVDDSGVCVGWCYYLVHKRSLQIGSFIASSDAAAQVMLDAVFRDEIRTSVDTVTLFASAWSYCRSLLVSRPRASADRATAAARCQEMACR